ncbi:MAG: hypothetical protein QG553_582 [Patescibacteria group bacterium]|nr:hypothetical protein [Patescibacteria group bacterium]
MTIDNLGNPDHEASVEKDQPRFMKAIGLYEEFLHGRADTVQGDADARAAHFDQLTRACAGLSGAAQNLDFAKEEPSLAGTQAEVACAKRLAEELSQPGIPPEVAGIYWDLYGPDLPPQA